MKAPTIKNETQYDGRTVSSVVRWVFRELELDGARVMVKVKMHRGCHAYQGRFYSNPHASGGYVWNNGDWQEIAPNVPAGINHLLVCRIGAEHVYPCDTHVYKRRDSPGTWEVANWREALVSITAHEAVHLRQYRQGKKNGRGRYNEVETEWAAFRLWRTWARKNGMDV